MIRYTLVVLSLVALLAGSAGAGDSNWPQWRGPNRDDISTERGLLKSWPEGGPNRVWLFDQAGVGYSGPAIVDNRLFIMGSEGEEGSRTEVLFALNAESGQLLWKAEIGELLENGWGDGPRATPTVSDGHVYCMGGQGELICARANDGEVVWRKNLVDEFQGKTPNWGYCESVLIDAGKLICSPGGKQAPIVALDSKTGDLIWKTTGVSDEVHYSSPIKIVHQGQEQYVKLTMNELVGLNPANGEILWKTDWPGRTAVIPTPVYHDGMVFITSGYNVGCKLIRLGADNEVTEVYANQNMQNHHGGVVLLDGDIYGYSDGKGWACLDLATGEFEWNERRVLGKGAVTYADGMLYCLDEGSGTVALVEASPEGWKERSRFELEPKSEIRKPRGKIWTHPVICDGRLYLRDQEYIYCFDVKQ